MSDEKPKRRNKRTANPPPEIEPLAHLPRVGHDFDLEALRAPFDPKMAEYILIRLGLGESLRSIESRPGYPSRETITYWGNTHEEFGVAMLQARQRGAFVLVDEIVEIADDGRNDWMEKFGRDGESLGWFVNGEAIQRSKLRIDARQWMLGKMLPKVFGEKVAKAGEDQGVEMTLQHVKRVALEVLGRLEKQAGTEDAKVVGEGDGSGT